MNDIVFDKQQNLKSSNFGHSLEKDLVNESARGSAIQSEDGEKMRKPRRRLNEMEMENEENR